jgi:hypothetical protein
MYDLSVRQFLQVVRAHPSRGIRRLYPKWVDITPRDLMKGIQELPQQRVQGFWPIVNGLHFSNAPDCWPDVPVFQINILGQECSSKDLGISAKDGLCGGIAFTVKDLFETGLLPPIDTDNPAAETPLFNYIVARQIHSMCDANTTKLVQWIQMRDGDSEAAKAVGLHDGISWNEITEEWPKRIKPDLDSNHPSPLILVHGHETPGVGLFAAITNDLALQHVVLAWGYDLDGTQLTLYIYDPDLPCHSICTIALDIGDPGPTVSLKFSDYTYPDRFRGFFRGSYEYHDPTQPVSAALIVDVISSPGITPAGPR